MTFARFGWTKTVDTINTSTITISIVNMLTVR